KADNNGPDYAHFAICLFRRSLSAARRQTTVRRVVIDGCWQFFRKPGEKLFLRKPGLLHQRRQNILPDGLLELRRRNLLVGAMVDPGLRSLALTIFREPFEQLVEPATEQTSDSGAAQHAAQATQHV